MEKPLIVLLNVAFMGSTDFPEHPLTPFMLSAVGYAFTCYTPPVVNFTCAVTLRQSLGWGIDFGISAARNSSHKSR